MLSDMEFRINMNYKFVIILGIFLLKLQINQYAQPCSEFLSNDVVWWENNTIPVQNQSARFFINIKKTDHPEIAEILPLFLHIGISSSSGGSAYNWSNVIGNWGTFQESLMITQECDSIFSFNFQNESIESFFSVFDSEIYAIHFVLRNSNGTALVKYPCSLEDSESNYTDLIDFGLPVNSQRQFGCLIPFADNFDPQSTIADCSCLYMGCTDVYACNYDEYSNFDDGSCIYQPVNSIFGQTNIEASSIYTYAVLPAAGSSYLWTVSNGAILSGQGTSAIQVLWGQNGPYQVSLTESNGTCSDVSTLLVVNSSCSLSAAISSTNGNAFCPGGTNELIASSNGTNLSYTWYLNGVEIASATEQSFGITSAGNYQVMVNDGLCSAVSQILNITQLPGVQWPEITVLDQNADCASASATITATGGNATSYEWSNGETSAEIIVTESGEYVLTVTNDSGCSAELPPVVINFAQSEPLPICLVTVNPDNGFNTIIWEPLTSEVIVNYVVLKETNAANQYEVIGTVPYGSDGLFEDINSNSAVQASRYKLAINDLCNVVSTNSPLHKTIHLTSNVGLNNTVNLIWSHYEGVDFLSYNIYRGSNPADMTLLATIASNLNSYTDLNPLSGQAYYFIEVEGIACDPSRSIQTSKSNLINYEFVNIQEIIAPIFSIYPNPTRDYITVQCNNKLIGEEYTIYDAAGKMVMKGRITSTSAMIDIKNLSAGEYVLSAGMASVRLVKN
jgi:hypothetical protein